jgi:hypothetical protein
MHAPEVHAHKMHAREVHAPMRHTLMRCTPVRYAPMRHAPTIALVALWPKTVVDLSRSDEFLALVVGWPLLCAVDLAFWPERLTFEIPTLLFQ